MKFLTLVLTGLLTLTAFAKPHFCHYEMKEQAIKFFAHYQEIDRETAEKSISDQFTERSSIRSPDGKRTFKVFETIALIGKDWKYRLRFIYAIHGNKIPRQDCVLMGEEVLDLNSL